MGVAFFNRGWELLKVMNSSLGEKSYEQSSLGQHLLSVEWVMQKYDGLMNCHFVACNKTPKEDKCTYLSDRVLNVLTYSIGFIPNCDDLPEDHSETPNVRLDVEVASLQVFCCHPSPRDKLSLGFLVV